MQLTQEKKQLTDGTEVISVGQWVAVGIQASALSSLSFRVGPSES